MKTPPSAPKATPLPSAAFLVQVPEAEAADAKEFLDAK